MSALGRPKSTSTKAIAARWQHLAIPQGWGPRPREWFRLVDDSKGLPSAHQAVLDIYELLSSIAVLEAQLADHARDMKMVGELHAVMSQYIPSDYW